MDLRKRCITIATLLCLIAGGDGAFARSFSLNDLYSHETDQEKKVRNLREHEIEQLRSVLGLRSYQNRRADLYFRLSEIYLEIYQQMFLLEGRAHEKDPKGLMDRTQSKKILLKGIESSQQILKLNRKYPKMDRVYYFLGFNYSELGQSQKGAGYFLQLVKQFPNSPFAGEAYRELGNEALKRDQYLKAKVYFESAIKGDLGSLRPSILHKLGWTYYRLKDSRRAIETLKLAISEAQKSDEKYLSLQEEALKDIAIFMTESGRVSEAIEYFRSVAGNQDYYPKILASLGKEYESRLQFAKAIEVYENLLKTNPDAETTLRVQTQLFQMEVKLKRYEPARARLNTVKIPSGEIAEDLKTVVSNLKAIVRSTATKLHAEARKSTQAKAQRASRLAAEIFYEAYLKFFLQNNQDPEHSEIQMYLAEVKSGLGKQVEASEIYRQVIASKDARYAKEASLLYVGSLEKALIQKSKATKRSHTGSQPSETERAFIQASDELAQLAPKSQEAHQAKLRSIQILAGYPSTREESSQRAESFIQNASHTDEASVAGRVWLQNLWDESQKDLDIQKVEAALKAIRSHSKIASKLKESMDRLEKKIQVILISRLEAQKDFAGAARSYESFAQKEKDLGKSEVAYQNAVTNYLNIKDYDSAIRVTREWQKRSPKNSKPRDIERSIATTALIEGDFDRAQKLFEEFSESLGDSSSLETAALIAEGHKKEAEAIFLLEKYMKRFPKEKSLSRISLKVALLLEKAGRDQLAADRLGTCVRLAGLEAAECASRLGDLYTRLKDPELARKHYTLASKMLKNPKGQNSPFIGYARYRLAEILEDSRRFAPMSGVDQNLKAALEQRTRFFSTLNHAYRDAVAAGGPWAISSLYRLALWTLGFSREIEAIQPPSTASAAEVRTFRSTLEALSKPLKIQAVQSLKTAYDTAVRNQVLSPVIPKIADLLNDQGEDRPVRAQGPRGGQLLWGASPIESTESPTTDIRKKLVQNPKLYDEWIHYGNRLWGQGYPLLARLAYERALALQPKSSEALNNRAVVLLSGEGQEDWVRVLEAHSLLLSALKNQSLFVPAKRNLALLYNYYRVFSLAKPLWEQVLVKQPSALAYEGMAVSLQGLGKFTESVATLQKAEDAEGDKSRFTRIYLEAAKSSESGQEGFKKCVSRLGDLQVEALEGFELESVIHLKGTCEQWAKGESF